MAIMLNNDKILSDDIVALLGEKHIQNGDYQVMLCCSEAGTPSIASFTSWDGSSIVSVEDIEQYKLGIALGVVPAPATDTSQGPLLLTRRNIISMFSQNITSFLSITGNSPDNGVVSTIPQDELLEQYGLNVIYDAYKDERFTKERFIMSPTREGWSYKGELPVNAQRTLNAQIAIRDANRFYQSKVFSSENKASHPLVRYDNARRLMSALTLGMEGCPAYPDYDKSEAHTRWKEKLFSDFLINANYTPDSELNEEVTAYRFYADLSILWEEIVSSSPIKLSLDSTILGSQTKLLQAFQMLAKAVDAHSFIDAYVAGVPLEDILA